MGCQCSSGGPDRTYRPDLRAPTVYGLHQPGIATPQLRFARLTAYDADEDVRAQLAAWTEQAEGLMRDGGLTVTIGLGERIFKEQRPAGLKPLPPFKGDALEFSGGDLCALICSDAPIEASLPGRVRWEREGTHGKIGALGFRDGVVIPRRPLDLDRHVWVNRRDRVGMVGGTYLVVRDIHVLDSFRRLTPDEQERVIGRHRAGTEKYDLPPDSHVNLARRTHLLRRGYDTHQGVLFLAFTNDPRRTYAPLQHKLAEHDALHPHTRHTGSAVFAIPPGAAPRNFLAQPLL